MFPALIMLLSDKARFYVEINAFEPGIWMFPILISNTIIFATVILYRKNKLPQLLKNLFKSIFNFEISHRIALVLVGILIALYAILNVGELYTEDEWEDFSGVKGVLQTLFDEYRFNLRIIPYSFAFITMEIFGTYRVAPFIASILCLVLTYLVTVQISKKRFAGIIALVLVLQSENFLIYDTTITYPIFWIMFFLLAMYFVFKSLALSPISFISAVFSHPLSVAFFPITILFIALLDLPKRRKILLLSSYFVIIVIGLVLIFTETIPIPVNFTLDDASSLDFSRIIAASSSILTQFRYDFLLVVFLLPLIVGLFLASKKGISNANGVLVLISGIILLIMFIPVLTSMGNTPYRILPLVFFFAIGVGTLLSKNINLQDESLSRKL